MVRSLFADVGSEKFIAWIIGLLFVAVIPASRVWIASR
jgi:hypothetical protein